MNPSTQTFLDSFINFEHKLPPSSEFKLSRIENVLKALGSPEKKLRCLHIAGTKGKGSTCIFVANILAASGKKVGLYTSPHIFDLPERIRILTPQTLESPDDFPGCIPSEDLDALIENNKTVLESLRNDTAQGRLTFFELFTALALLYFAQKKVDCVVLETGLGGRLDATNVVETEVAAITSIGMDHTLQLGDTVEKIAAEKAAIIKNKKQKVVIGVQKSEAMRVISNRCRSFGIIPHRVGIEIQARVEELALNEQTFSVATPFRQYEHLKTRLIGEYQAWNAATAIGAAEMFNSKLNVSDVKRGISATRWPGRFEIIAETPLTIADAAHNPESSEALVRLLNLFELHKPITFIVGVSADKDISGICRPIGQLAHQIITTQARSPRAYKFTAKDLKEYFPGKNVAQTGNIEEALEAAAEFSGTVIITGSIFIVSEAKRVLGV